MAIADKTTYWKLKSDGSGDPSSNTNPELYAWTLTGAGGSSVNGEWVITNQTVSYTPTSTAYTIWAVIKYNTTPVADTVLLRLHNGTHYVNLVSKGNDTSLGIDGNTDDTFSNLDLKNEHTIVRLTLDSSGNARLYVHDIIEDDDAATSYLSVVGVSDVGTKTIQFSNDSGSVSFANVLGCDQGAFSPDELSPSQFINDAFHRVGLKVVETLQNSNRPFLKNVVDDSAIIYGYDISQSMIARLPAPSIYVLQRQVASEALDVLGGHGLTTIAQVQVFILTRGTNYRNAYRSCLDITGDVFDEVMTNLGLDANQDAILGYELVLDNKMDEGETVCVHKLTFDTMRRHHLQRR